MAFPWDNSDNIDPQLLMQQVGAFSFPASDHDQERAESAEGPLDRAVDMSIVDARDDGVDLYREYQNLDVDGGIDVVMDHVVMDHGFGPITPHRPQTFNPEARVFYPTPPSSTQVTGNTSFQSPSWHDHNPLAVLSDGGSEASAPHGSYRYVDDAGFLTPNSATTSQVGAAHHRAMTGSPTPRLANQLCAGPRLYSQAGQVAPAMNMDGGPTNVPARENMHVWVAGTSSGPATIRNRRQSLAPEGNRTRAASVASSIGQGDFVCEGSEGKPCGKRFPNKSKLNHHSRCHKAARNFCTLCPAEFYYPKDLKRHMKTHGPRDRHLICNNIGCKYHTKPFARRDHRDRHERSCRHSQA
ncbi:hypothetical protein BST61_g2892 [Cercospora zeina]